MIKIFKSWVEFNTYNKKGGCVETSSFDLKISLTTNRGKSAESEYLNSSISFSDFNKIIAPVVVQYHGILFISEKHKKFINQCRKKGVPKCVKNTEFTVEEVFRRFSANLRTVIDKSAESFDFNYGVCSIEGGSENFSLKETFIPKFYKDETY